MTERIHEFLRNRREIGQDDVPSWSSTWRSCATTTCTFAKTLCPTRRVFYAVKANPAPEVLSPLAALGSCFDIASVAEIEMALAAGATPDRISFGNTDQEGARRRARLSRSASGCSRSTARPRSRRSLAPRPARRCSAASCSTASAPNGRCRASSAASRKWPSTCWSMRTGSASRPTACRSTSARSSATSKPGTRALASAATVFRACAERGINLSHGEPRRRFPDQVPEESADG